MDEDFDPQENELLDAIQFSMSEWEFQNDYENCKTRYLNRQGPEQAFLKMLEEEAESKEMKEMEENETEIEFEGYVYWIKCETLKLIKIGFSKNPTQRLTQLNMGPTELTLLKAIPADRELERYWHKVLKDSRVNGEWFLPSGEVMDSIGKDE